MEALTKTNYVDLAEKVIRDLKNDYETKQMDPKKKVKEVSSTQLRKILEMTNILNGHLLREEGDKLSEELQSEVQYTIMKIAYAAGRDNGVKDFEKKAGLMARMKDIGDSKEKLHLFCRYMEALVAYQKFVIGKD